jgi:hypothetical protein
MSTTDFQPAADHPSSEDFADLVACHLAGELDEGQRNRLNNVLMADLERRDEFVAFCLHANLIGACIGPKLLANEDLDTLCEDDDSHEGNAQPQCPPPAFVLFGNSGGNLISRFSSGWPVAYLIATVIFAVGLAVGAFVHVTQPIQYVGPPGSVRSSNPESPIPNPTSIVGRVTGMVDCVWEGTGGRGQGSGAANQKSEIINHDSLIHLGDRLALKSGLLEITYDTGASVILQGPVTYEVESSSGGYLSIGKLTAKLEKKSEVSGQRSDSVNQKSPDLCPLNSELFAIRTPTAIVTDLGTEFGVEVDRRGVTRSHVFRGSVEVRKVLEAGAVDTTGQVLHENESVEVSHAGGLRKIGVASDAKPSNFVRAIPKATIKIFDLADVVAGGDGFSGRQDAGIDPTNGRPTNIVPTEEHFPPFKGDGRYHRVEALPFVDGVFIPYSANGPVQLDSAGHRFAEFNTRDNLGSFHVWVGKDWNLCSTLNGVDYASAGHRVLGLSTNKGITFDLEAIRRANPDWKLVRFLAMTGNTEGKSELGVSVSADLWVFTDGKVRFKRREINRYSEGIPVSIPILDGDRFLTLVATDGGDGIGWDHIMFGDPRLEMTSIGTKSKSETPKGTDGTMK